MHRPTRPSLYRKPDAIYKNKVKPSKTNNVSNIAGYKINIQVKCIFMHVTDTN